MKKITVGTKFTLLETQYTIKRYEDEKGEYFVSEQHLGGNLNGIYRDLDDLIEDLENLIGRWTIRLAMNGVQLDFKFND